MIHAKVAQPASARVEFEAAVYITASQRGESLLKPVECLCQRPAGSTSTVTDPASHSVHNDLRFPARGREKHLAGRNLRGLREDGMVTTEMTADSLTWEMETKLKGSFETVYERVPK